MIDSPTRCIKSRNIAHGTRHARNESKQAGEKLRVRQMVRLKCTSKDRAHRKRCLIEVVEHSEPLKQERKHRRAVIFHLFPECWGECYCFLQRRYQWRIQFGRTGRRQ